MTYVHVHAPQPDSVAIKRLTCPTCNRHRPFVVAHTPWYGSHFTCLKCGENFDGDEGQLPRPFARGWREKSIEAARRSWRRFHAPRDASVQPLPIEEP